MLTVVGTMSGLVGLTSYRFDRSPVALVPESMSYSGLRVGFALDGLGGSSPAHSRIVWPPVMPVRNGHARAVVSVP